MSTHIQAFIPDTDAEFIRHKKILLSCVEGKVSLPKETAKYFGDNEAYESLLDDKLEIELKEDIHYTIYNDESSSGFEVDITKLPKGVTKIRFYNNW